MMILEQQVAIVLVNSVVKKLTDDRLDLSLLHDLKIHEDEILKREFRGGMYATLFIREDYVVASAIDWDWFKMKTLDTQHIIGYAMVYAKAIEADADNYIEVSLEYGA